MDDLPKKTEFLSTSAILLISVGMVWALSYFLVSLYFFGVEKGHHGFARAGSFGTTGALLFFFGMEVLQSFLNQEKENKNYILLKALDQIEQKADAARYGHTLHVSSTGASGLNDFNPHHFPFGQVAQGFEHDLKLEVKTINRMEKRRFRWSLFQLMVVVVATLQWGYGDLFHCWANGNGWDVCY